MESINIQGTIILIDETQTFASGFKKRTVVVETNEQYPQKIPIDFIKDKCEILNGYMEGQDVTIGINLRGNEYNGKYYLNAQGWKINLSDEQPQSQSAVDNYQAQQNNAPEPPAEDFEDDDDHDDLPF